MAIASLGSEPAAEPGSDTRVALRILQVGVIGVVLAALPYPLFDLERHAVPKELVAELTGFGGAIYGLVRAKKLQITAADALLAVFLAVSLVSAILAENHWLAFRAFGLSLSGVLVFWSARTVAPSSREALVRTLAAAVALAAGTALLQAYGVELSVMAERRAPGGTFGNRNFMTRRLPIPLRSEGASPRIWNTPAPRGSTRDRRGAADPGGGSGPLSGWSRR